MVSRNRNFSVESQVRMIVQDELAKQFGASSFSISTAPRTRRTRGNGRRKPTDGRGRVVNPQDKRLKRNRPSANA